jgi:hypothetical protein
MSKDFTVMLPSVLTNIIAEYAAEYQLIDVLEHNLDKMVVQQIGVVYLAIRPLFIY